jgi:hypothetical protein
MSLQVDDEEKMLVRGTEKFLCDPDMTTFILGADLQGTNGAVFNLYDLALIGKTLPLDEKLEFYSHYLEGARMAGSYLEYESASFLHITGDGSLIQELEEFKPILRPLGVRVGAVSSMVPENAPRPRTTATALPAPPAAT